MLSTLPVQADTFPESSASQLAHSPDSPHDHNWFLFPPFAPLSLQFTPISLFFLSLGLNLLHHLYVSLLWTLTPIDFVPFICIPNFYDIFAGSKNNHNFLSTKISSESNQETFLNHLCQIVEYSDNYYVLYYWFMRTWS